MGALEITALILGLVDRAAAFSAVLNKAKSEGRDVTQAEIDTAVAADDVARKNEQDAIARARKREGKQT